MTAKTPTPEETFVAALKAYAESSTYAKRNVVISEWAAVLYVEEFKPSGEIETGYLHITSKRSSWHALRGLVGTLSDHVYRQSRDARTN